MEINKIKTYDLNIHKNRKTSHVHGYENLTLLKYQ